MARITVEDSTQFIPNRFELVMIAAQRVRQIIAGAELQVNRDSDKNTVVALREIAEGKLDVPDLFDQLVRGKQKFVEADDFNEDLTDQTDTTPWIGLEGAEAGAFADALEEELMEADDLADDALSEEEED